MPDVSLAFTSGSVREKAKECWRYPVTPSHMNVATTWEGLALRAPEGTSPSRTGR